MSKKCVLFVSADNDFLFHFAKNVLRDFEVVLEKRYNRMSEKNFESSEFLELEEFDYLFNFLSPIKIPMFIINKAKYGAINFHPGPHCYPGVGAASLALFDQCETFGVTAHFMEENYDSGPIILERNFKIDKEFNAERLFERALFECCLLLNDVVHKIKNGDRFNVVNQWSRNSITRKEFENWLVIHRVQSNENIERKITSIIHSKYGGPYVYIGEHKFRHIPKQ
jgi:methionyl-tRNA formyltransferase